jgi:hypothetical protein
MPPLPDPVPPVVVAPPVPLPPESSSLPELEHALSSETPTRALTTERLFMEAMGKTNR